MRRKSIIWVGDRQRRGMVAAQAGCAGGGPYNQQRVTSHRAFAGLILLVAALASTLAIRADGRGDRGQLRRLLHWLHGLRPQRTLAPEAGITRPASAPTAPTLSQNEALPEVREQSVALLAAPVFASFARSLPGKISGSTAKVICRPAQRPGRRRCLGKYDNIVSWRRKAGWRLSRGWATRRRGRAP